MNESKKPYASVGGTELSLWDITKILLAKIHWLLLAGVVVAAGVYAVVTIFVTPTYESRVSFYVYKTVSSASKCNQRGYRTGRYRHTRLGASSNPLDNTSLCRSYCFAAIWSRALANERCVPAGQNIKSRQNLRPLP